METKVNPEDPAKSERGRSFNNASTAMLNSVRHVLTISKCVLGYMRFTKPPLFCSYFHRKMRAFSYQNMHTPFSDQ